VVARSAKRRVSKEKSRRVERGRPQVLHGYHRILVPFLENAESEKAMAMACRLAADRHGSITVVTVIEVPSLLPLDAHMTDEEKGARELLSRAEAVGASYGVRISARVLRAREAESAIVEQAEALAAEVIVIGSARKTRRSARAPIFGRTIQHVLKKAPCRVMVVAGLSGVKVGASRTATANSRHSAG